MTFLILKWQNMKYILEGMNILNRNKFLLRKVDAFKLFSIYIFKHSDIFLWNVQHQLRASFSRSVYENERKVWNSRGLLFFHLVSGRCDSCRSSCTNKQLQANFASISACHAGFEGKAASHKSFGLFFRLANISKPLMSLWDLEIMLFISIYCTLF